MSVVATRAILCNTRKILHPWLATTAIMMLLSSLYVVYPLLRHRHWRAPSSAQRPSLFVCFCVFFLALCACLAIVVLWIGFVGVNQ